MVADLEQKGPTMNEIVGGIGYIFGLMGVAIYFSSRKKKS
jgi:nickel transport protein